MLDLETRTAILRLKREGHGVRAIARSLHISRAAVRRVLESGVAEVPRLEREEELSPHLDRIRELYQRCRGNRVRVWEELKESVSYSTLTGFLRRHQIGVEPRVPSGHYHFEPAEEMQHDTSPHTVTIAGKRRTLHCASLVLCFSRLIYAQLYARWSRFEAKVFLTRAVEYFGGAAGRCMVDNSSVILARGSGKHAVVAAEIEAFATRFGFCFVAHAVGHANRSARVERPFHYIEHNFYAGRDFQSLADLNRQLLHWIERVNQRPKRTLGAVPAELWIAEKPRLRPLPLHIPEPYELHERRADVDGFVCLHTNRYSVPPQLIGRKLSVRETYEHVRIFDGHRLVAEHARLEPGSSLKVRLPGHFYVYRPRPAASAPLPEENTLRHTAPELATLVDRLRRHYGGQAARSVRRLHRLYLDYPTDALLAAVRTALAHNLVHIGRIERMVLGHIAGEFFFRLPTDRKDHDDE